MTAWMPVILDAPGGMAEPRGGAGGCLATSPERARDGNLGRLFLLMTRLGFHMLVVIAGYVS
jgi:hypothetical protein